MKKTYLPTLVVAVTQCEGCPFWQPADYEHDLMCVHPAIDGEEHAEKPITKLDGRSMPVACPLRMGPTLVISSSRKPDDS